MASTPESCPFEADVSRYTSTSGEEVTVLVVGGILSPLQSLDLSLHGRALTGGSCVLAAGQKGLTVLSVWPSRGWLTFVVEDTLHLHATSGVSDAQ